MPQQSAKQKPVGYSFSTQPSKSILQRLFGGVMSPSLEREWPELATQFATHELSMPGEAAATNRIFEMGPISKWLYPEAQAITGPFGTVGFNRKLIEQEKQNLGDVMTHELTHVGQGKRAFFKKFSKTGRSELENEAINKEAMRKVIRGDIHLPIDTGPTRKKK